MVTNWTSTAPLLRITIPLAMKIHCSRRIYTSAALLVLLPIALFILALLYSFFFLFWFSSFFLLTSQDLFRWDKDHKNDPRTRRAPLNACFPIRCTFLAANPMVSAAVRHGFAADEAAAKITTMSFSIIGKKIAISRTATCVCRLPHPLIRRRHSSFSRSNDSSAQLLISLPVRMFFADRPSLHPKAFRRSFWLCLSCHCCC